MNVGDSYPGTTAGVIDYSFGNFKLQVISLPPLSDNNLQQESTAPTGTNQLAVATFNVENLAPTDPPDKYATLAELIVNHLQSPDVIAIEEIQDNNGTTNDGTVDAATTWGLLISAIQTAGGATYDYRQIDPVNGQDGGAPGGNIRQGFLFRTDRGLSFVDRSCGGCNLSTTAVVVTGSGSSTQLSFSPGRIDPTNSAFDSSRKPLAAEFTFNGHHLFVIANHFNSKGGDDPLFGHFQPPIRSSEVQRHQQAQIEHDFINAIVSADPNADVVVLGDLNDFEFSDTISILKGTPAILNDLMDTLPQAERYSYVFEGNSQTLDHTLFSNHLFNTWPFDYDVVHVNSEFATQASDHEPQVSHVTINDPPIIGPITAPLAPTAVNTTINVSAAFTDTGILDTHTVSIDWGDGNVTGGSVNEMNGSGTATGSHAYTLPGVYTISMTVTDTDGASATATSDPVVIYDPNGSFVTGGGWIESPTGAYIPDPTLSGKAIFGFVVKYKKGANVPVGETEFQFKAGDLNFKVTSYQWLVINRTSAQFKGYGTINGEGNYGFMIWAGDGSPDTFRLKIWINDDETRVVYDNGVAQPIDGGSIVIYK